MVRFFSSVQENMRNVCRLDGEKEHQALIAFLHSAVYGKGLQTRSPSASSSPVLRRKFHTALTEENSKLGQETGANAKSIGKIRRRLFVACGALV